jgi:hypothetical protein
MGAEAEQGPCGLALDMARGLRHQKRTASPHTLNDRTC